MGSLGSEIAKKKAMWLYPKILGFNPSERWGHSACYSCGLVYVFGGCCGGLHFSDVLMLNLDTVVWNALATTGQGPGPRDSHSAVLVGQKMIVFGGTNGTKKVNDLHILDLGTKEWTRPECEGTPPAPRESHTATLVGDEKLVIFGGSGEGEANYLNDLHVLNLKTMKWSSPEVKGDMPVPRDSHSAIGMGNRLFVYGGDCGDRYYGDVDMFDMDTLTWSRLDVQGSLPGVRAGHATVNIGKKVYVIGGVGDKHYYNDVWVLDVSTCSWTELGIGGQQPQGRFSHTAVVTDSDITIYGGCGEDERPLNELLVLQLGAEHPNGRYNISMCKIFGNHWNQERRRLPREAENNSKNMFVGSSVDVVRNGVPDAEFGSKRLSTSDTLHPKRRRTANSMAWEIESEQEEHSLSLSQHSSPSQSDQEQTPVHKITDSIAGPLGSNLFKPLNQIPSNCQPNNFSSRQKELSNLVQRTPHDLHFLRELPNQPKPEQFHHVVRTGVVRTDRQEAHLPSVDQKLMEIGAEVRGKVDAAFDSGFLMTATVNGKIFRGVLFAPGHGVVSRGAIVAQNPASTRTHNAVTQPIPNLNQAEPYNPPQNPLTFSMPESGQSFRQAQVARPHPGIQSAASSLGKEPKLRSDLQGVVLTLGGPGSSC